MAKGRQAVDVILKYNQMKRPWCTYLAVARGQALNAAGCLIVRAAEVIGTRRGKAGRTEWPIVARLLGEFCYEKKNYTNRLFGQNKNIFG